MGEHKINFPNGGVATMSGPDVTEFDAVQAEVLWDLVVIYGKRVLEMDDEFMQELHSRLRARGFDPRTRARFN